MREQAASGGAISPVQQMMASGTGALLTSLFGEILKKEPRKVHICLDNEAKISHLSPISPLALPT